MIIKSIYKFDIGQTVICGIDVNGVFSSGEIIPYGQPIHFLAISSKDEYIKFCKEEDLNTGRIFENDNFYLVSTD